MAELKTRQNSQSVSRFIQSVEDPVKRKDCEDLKRLMAKITGKRAKMWGDSIVGFGSYHYKYKSGREGDYFVTGFSPRKQNLTIYIMPGFSQYRDKLAKIGKHKTSVSCLYVKNLEQLDMGLLSEIISDSVSRMKKMYSCDLK
jgi:hypothetical protein